MPSEPIPEFGYTVEEITKTLHAADGLLSLVGYRYPGGIPHDVVDDLQMTSGLCRSLARRIEANPARLAALDTSPQPPTSPEGEG